MKNTVRIGTGYDVHRFKEGRRLILGGVEIEFEFGLEGHSDADVLFHAVTDSLLGAAALGDIGIHFPPEEPQYKDADSGVFLGKAVGLLRDKGFTVGNIDATVVAEKPKLSPYILQMRENISKICQIVPENVSVKATTEEGLGLAGLGIGVHAVATVLVR